MGRVSPHSIAALSRNIKFRDLRLIEVRATQSVRLGPLPKITKNAAMLQAQRIERGDEKLLRFLPILTLESRYDDDPAKDGIVIIARYQVTYIATSLRHAREATIAEFGIKEIMPMIWPYWQELVTSILGRMQLPFLRIEPFSQATLTRGEPPQELQALGLPASEPKQARRKKKAGKKR